MCVGDVYIMKSKDNIDHSNVPDDIHAAIMGLSPIFRLPFIQQLAKILQIDQAERDPLFSNLRQQLSLN